MSVVSSARKVFCLLLSLAVFATATIVVMLNHQDTVSRIFQTLQAKRVSEKSERNEQVFVTTTGKNQAENISKITKGKEELYVKVARNNTLVSEINKTILVLCWSKTFGQTPPVNVDPTTWPFF